jgi:galactokinase
LGVVSQLVENGFAISGFNLVLKGNVPVGAGLSSSAALCCSTIYAINELLELGLSKIDMAWLAQKAEHTFASVKCGIMDQFASLFGRESCAILLDCKTLEYKYIPVSLDGYKIVLMDTKVKHSLKSSEFNNRRFECEQGVNIIKNHYPHVNSLSDVKLEMLEVLENGSKIYQRCWYVVEEIKRVNDACDLLVNNNIHSFGQLMYATHNGLSNLYEVSTTELDFVVQQCLKYKDFIGARMMGGGFGGCVIAIIKEESDHLTRKIGEAYKEKFGIDMETYFIRIEDGVKRIGYKL